MKLRKWVRASVAVFSALFAVVTMLSSPVSAAIIGADIAIPDSEVLINFNNTGLDWVYAGPIAPNEFGPGEIEGPSFRAAEGWRFATLSEWAIKPLWQDFTKPGQLVPDANNAFTDHSRYRFTTEYWSSFTHVDLFDAADGKITNGFDIGNSFSFPETWYVRDSAVQTVPEPFSIAIWGIGAVCICGVTRRRHQSVLPKE